ncbi:uncharacterized protein LOC117088716 isoform X2 [Trachypithecus francoisi]|uniref:uncharacterized protein LOC117088716 isoform X2 n=1 Tax=Trachypithecus francoisi TaxID=54180 RepID=UPI00141B6C72|nr:uncharacterized protein LOC117088716 isoform X2 [Trachypithecus francoisi]
MWKAQAGSGGSSAASQAQARPDAVWGTPVPHIGSTSDSPPLDLLTGVLESGISLKEPQALQKRGRSPLFERREAEGSGLSELSADSPP